jgi:hypothetical protein
MVDFNNSHTLYDQKTGVLYLSVTKIHNSATMLSTQKDNKKKQI